MLKTVEAEHHSCGFLHNIRRVLNKEHYKADLLINRTFGVSTEAKTLSGEMRDTRITARDLTITTTLSRDNHLFSRSTILPAYARTESGSA